jgi:hypothetical protein
MLMGRKHAYMACFRPINIVPLPGLGHGTEPGGEMRVRGAQDVAELARLSHGMLTAASALGNEKGPA